MEALYAKLPTTPTQNIFYVKSNTGNPQVLHEVILCGYRRRLEYTEVFLPKKWFKKQQTGQTTGISANHLLIGTGGLSGNIAIRPTYSTQTVGNTTQVVDYFGDFFNLDYNGLQVKSMDGTSTQPIGSCKLRIKVSSHLSNELNAQHFQSL